MIGITIDVSDIKQYLPTTCNYANPHAPKVPAISYPTFEIFRKCHVNTLNYTWFNYRVSSIKQVVSEIKNFEKVETLHKCLSILAIAATVAVVAAVILLPLCPIGTAFVVGCGIGFGMTGSIIFEKFRLNQNIDGGHKFLAALIGVLTLGLSTPIHYAVAAFGRKANMEKQLSDHQSKAERNFHAFRFFLEQNGAELEAKIKANLAELKADGPKKEEHRTEPYLELAEECERSIKGQEQALVELETLKKFYLGNNP